MPFAGSSKRSSLTDSIDSTAGGPGASSPPTRRRRCVARPHATWLALSPELESKISNTNTRADLYSGSGRLGGRLNGSEEAFHARAGGGSKGCGGAGQHVPDPGLPGSGCRYRLV